MPAIDLHQLFSRSLFVTKYNGMHWVESLSEFPALIAAGLDLAVKRRAVISPVAGRFALDQVQDAFRTLESGPQGKVLILPAL